MYLFGQFTQRGMVMKFAKNNMNLDWKLEIKDANDQAAPYFSEMNEIYSYVQPINDEWIYACGYKWEDPLAETYRKASLMKLSSDGQI